MKQWVKDLLVLQAADMKTKRMNKRLKEIPAEKQAVLSDLEAEKQKLQKAKTKVLEAEKDIRQLESKINEVKGKIDDIQSKSAMVRKNDEYKAMLNEIAAQKSFISSLETKEIKMMDDLETDRKTYATAESLIANLENEAKENISDLEEIEKTLKSKIESSIKSREPLVKNVDSRLLPIYVRLIKKEGEPLTKIHNNTCGYCHLKLTPQTLNDAKKGLITACDTCGHIVYYPDDNE